MLRKEIFSGLLGCIWLYSLILTLRTKTFWFGFTQNVIKLDIQSIRNNAHPVESGDLDAFIERWGFPLYCEIKYDGERAWIQKLPDGTMIAFNKHKTVYAEDSHKELFDGFRNIGNSFLIEGELCSKNGGIYSYLSTRNSGKDLVFHCFDILTFEDNDLRNEIFGNRRVVLDLIENECQSLHENRAWQYLVKTKKDLLSLINEIINAGNEGVVIKPSRQKYGEGFWLKIKREETIDATILGIKKKDKYLEDGISRSFRLGLFNGKEFIHVGDVGSGLRLFEKEALGQVLQAIKTDEDNDYIYVKPKIVLEVVAESKSEEGRLIHPRIKKIRTDKSVEECKIDQLNLLAVKK